MISDIPVHEVHVSELRTFLECRRQWDLQYVQRWEPIKTPRPLEFGTAWHRCLEELYNPSLWEKSTKQELFRRALLALEHELDRQKSAYLDRTETYTLDPDDSVEYEYRYRLGKNMLHNLVRNIDKDEFRPIAVEEEYEAPITWSGTSQPITCVCIRCRQNPQNSLSEYWNSSIDRGSSFQGLPLYVRCRIDALFEYRDGSILIADHKSAVQLLAKNAIATLQRDIQLGTYLWVARMNGLPVTGALYNQFRKAYPKPPKRLTASPDGRQYSISRTQLTDYYTAKRVFKTDRWAYTRGLYDDYLTWLKNDSTKEFFRQFIIFKSPDQLNIVGDLLRTYAIEMTNVVDIYPNSSVRFVCDLCKFNEPCLSLYEGRTGEEVRQELEASFTQQPLLWYERERLERRT